jgi:ssDNA-specific exonuclease RecJ
MRNLKIKTLYPVKEGWCDKDMIMLHACFQLLTDFVEQEDGLNHCNYEAHKESIDECKYLYDWWKENLDTVSIDDKIADEHLLRLVKIRGFLWT